jgi:5'-3' exonuclease
LVHLIDASVYVFRAYYSLPPDMTDEDGNPVHALYGFARFIGELLERARPDYVAVAFDGSLSTSFRNQIYPPYKANREPARRIWHCSSSAAASSVRIWAWRSSAAPSTRPMTSSVRWSHACAPKACAARW